jgi:hypothetical protein
MLRKLLSLGALVVIAAMFGAGKAPAKADHTNPAGHVSDGKAWSPEGFSDGRRTG